MKNYSFVFKSFKYFYFCVHYWMRHCLHLSEACVLVCYKPLRHAFLKWNLNARNVKSDVFNLKRRCWWKSISWESRHTPASTAMMYEGKWQEISVRGEVDLCTSGHCGSALWEMMLSSVIQILSSVIVRLVQYLARGVFRSAVNTVNVTGLAFSRINKLWLLLMIMKSYKKWIISIVVRPSVTAVWLVAWPWRPAH